MIIVEEFIPRRETSAMLSVTERVLKLDNELAADAATNLRRSLVWMEKYLAPTTEFWDWPSERHQIDKQTHINVTFIGMGWLVGLERQLDDGPQHLPTVESELTRALSELTSGLRIEAKLRLNVSRFGINEVKRLATTLKAYISSVEQVDCALTLKHEGSSFTIDFEAEALSATGLNRNSEVTLRRVLTHIREFGNRQYQGADWCAYKRRRLTIVQYAAEESESFGDESLQLDPRGLFAGQTTPTTSTVYVSGRDGDESPAWRVGFPHAPFHLGIVHPRLMLERIGTENQCHEALSEVEMRTYLSYCWTSHYTRLWEYLVFEDLYTYIDDVRRVQPEVDITTGEFHQKYRELSDLRAEVDFLRRLDGGAIRSYVPPASVVRSEYDGLVAQAGESGIVEWMQSWLIPSTITTLSRDPLLGVLPVLDLEESRLNHAFTTAAQFASLRMQRTLQALQFAIIVGVAAQLVSFLELGVVVERLLAETPVGEMFDQVEQWLEWGNTDASVIFLNLIMTVALAWFLLKLSRSSWSRRMFDAE